MSIVWILPLLLAASGSPPPPGLYEVSSRTMVDHGELQVELSQDGATGSDTMTEADSGVVAHSEGEGPVRTCIQSGVAPDLPFAGASSMRTSVHYTRLDDTHWQADITVAMPAPGTVPASSMAPLLASARARATPAERAKIDALAAQLPAMQRQQDRVLAQTRAQLLEQLKTAEPEDAAAIRQTLAMLDGAPGTERTQHATQVYRRIGDHCGP